MAGKDSLSFLSKSQTRPRLRPDRPRADEREAHIREVEQFGQSLPEGSYGRRNREAIAARETRVATRLRAVEHAYRIANDRDSALKPPDPATAPASPEAPADREIELE
jgi:hypothetical protein